MQRAFVAAYALNGCGTVGGNVTAAVTQEGCGEMGSEC